MREHLFTDFKKTNHLLISNFVLPGFLDAIFDSYSGARAFRNYLLNFWPLVFIALHVKGPSKARFRRMGNIQDGRRFRHELLI